MTPEQISSLQAFWAEEKNFADLERMLKQERLEDTAREKEIALALMDLARNNVAIDGFPFTSPAEIAEKALILLGGNPDGLTFTDDEDTVTQNISEMLKIAYGESGPASLYSEPVAHGILAHWNNPESTGFSAQMKSEIDDFLTIERKQDLLNKLENGTLTTPFSDDSVEDFITRMKAEMPAETAPEVTPDLDSETPVEPEAESPSDPDNADEPAPDNDDEQLPENKASAAATLSTAAAAEELGKLSAKAEADFAKFQLVQDLRLKAQMEMNRLMQADPSLVHRTVVDKLSDKLQFGLYNMANPDHMHYPSESIFGQSLARMDSNGRVEEELLLFKNTFSGPKVEFPKHNVPKEIYAIAAQKCILDGIRKPHIGSTFRNPKNAIMFMQQTVDALVDAGYDIEDISVDRHIREAFENYKQLKLAESLTITEAPDVEEPEQTNGPEPLLQEKISADNQKLNQRLHAISKQVNDEEKPIPLNQLKNEEIVEIMSYASFLGEERTWQELQEKPGLTPISYALVKQTADYINKLLYIADPANKNEIPEGKELGIRQAELLRDLTLHTLIPVYGDERCKRAWQTVTRKVQENAPLNEEGTHNTNNTGTDNTNNTGTENAGIDKESMTDPDNGSDEEKLEQQAMKKVLVDGDDWDGNTDLNGPDESQDFGEVPPLDIPIDEDELSRAQEGSPEYSDYDYDNSSAPLQDTQKEPEPHHDAQPIHPLLPVTEITGFNVGGVNIDSSMAAEWKALGNTHTDLKDLPKEQLLVLAAMDHQEWSLIKSVDWLSRAESALIERRSQEVHNALAPHQPDNTPLSDLQFKIREVFPENLLPPQLKTSDPNHTPPVEPPAQDKEPALARPKR